MAEETHTKEESNFNMALARLKRVDILLSTATAASMTGDFVNWNNCLNSVAREISFAFNEDEKLYNEAYKIVIGELIPEFLSKIKYDKGIYVLKNPYDSYPNYSILGNLLSVYEDFVREALSKRSMLGSNKPDISKSVSEMS